MYSEEQIQQVKNIDMIDFLSSEYGYTFKKTGSSYKCIEHDSLTVGHDRKLWYWNLHKIGGKGIFQWEQKIEGLSFKEIMEKFAGKPAFQSANIVEDHTGNFQNNTSPSGRRYFDEQQIPIKDNGKYSNVFAYLTKTRCIAPHIVNELIQSHKLYQDTRKNAVFTNLDEQGNIRFWCARGTNTYKKFTRNASGSNNPYYGFSLITNPKSDTLYVFEAPVDLLSHCTIADIKSGVPGSWKQQNRLALLGVSDTALDCYLPRLPNVKTIKFCLDNDETGITATEELKKKYYELGYRIEVIHYKSQLKDINEFLCSYCEKHGLKEPEYQNKKPTNQHKPTAQVQRQEFEKY